MCVVFNMYLCAVTSNNISYGFNVNDQLPASWISDTIVSILFPGYSSRFCPAARFAHWRMMMAPWTAWVIHPVRRPVCPAKRPPRPSPSPPATVNVTSDGQEEKKKKRGIGVKDNLIKQVIVPALSSKEKIYISHTN